MLVGQMDMPRRDAHDQLRFAAGRPLRARAFASSNLADDPFDRAAIECRAILVAIVMDLLVGWILQCDVELRFAGRRRCTISTPAAVRFSAPLASNVARRPPAY